MAAEVVAAAEERALATLWLTFNGPIAGGQAVRTSRVAARRVANNNRLVLVVFGRVCFQDTSIFSV